MKPIATIILAAASSVAAWASPAADTIRISDFVRPDTYENCTAALQAAIDSCRHRPGALLLFEHGRYDVWPEGAVRKEIYISNTSSETECPSKEKTIGLHFEGLQSVCVEGAGATLMMHGKITPIAIDRCHGFSMRNLTIDFERPGGSELTYTDVKPGIAVVRAHPDTRYAIAGRRLHLIGEGWRSNRVHCISYSPTDGHATYSRDWAVLSGCDVEEIGPRLLAFSVPDGFMPERGATLTLRDITRDQVGTLILESTDISFSDINMRYMHGLGIVGQYSRNVSMRRVDCRPAESSGRILASSADFMHFSGCSGAIDIADCNFSGAHDDAINVHGTNLRIEQLTAPDEALLRFMHHQSYGFAAYHPGDTVAFIDPATMLRTDTAVVAAVSMENPRHIAVRFDRPVPSGVEPGATCVENLSCTPSLRVSGCSFTRLSTRAILATTPRRIVIENNTFTGIGMAAVLIEGDAQRWYESGAVTDVAIRGNTFIDCGYNTGVRGATIALNPSNTIVSADAPVHENVRITGNTFITGHRPVLSAKSTTRLQFSGNTVDSDSAPVFIFDGCSGVYFSANHMQRPRIERTASGPIAADF